MLQKYTILRKDTNKNSFFSFLNKKHLSIWYSAYLFQKNANYADYANFRK
jgi:hypothetical protein